MVLILFKVKLKNTGLGFIRIISTALYLTFITALNLGWRTVGQNLPNLSVKNYIENRNIINFVVYLIIYILQKIKLFSSSKSSPFF
jgi:hypothetical protein